MAETKATQYVGVAVLIGGFLIACIFSEPKPTEPVAATTDSKILRKNPGQSYDDSLERGLPESERSESGNISGRTPHLPEGGVTNSDSEGDPGGEVEILSGFSNNQAAPPPVASTFQRQIALVGKQGSSEKRSPYGAPATRQQGRSRTPADRPRALRTHQVRDGDTLASLAKRYLGSSERSDELYSFNQSILDDPNVLPIGTLLRIPPPGAQFPLKIVRNGSTRQSQSVRKPSSALRQTISRPNGRKPSAGKPNGDPRGSRPIIEGALVPIPRSNRFKGNGIAKPTER